VTGLGKKFSIFEKIATLFWSVLLNIWSLMNYSRGKCKVGLHFEPFWMFFLTFRVAAQISNENVNEKC
jgi:hypothetical protein